MQSYILQDSQPRTKQNKANKQQSKRKNQRKQKQTKSEELPTSGMVVSRPLKRVKRVVADYYSFNSFGTSACPAGDRTLDGPFRSNIKSFLISYADGPLPPKISSPPFIHRWQVRLRLDHQQENVFVPLHIVEENVRCSDSLYCDHCRVVAGWQENPVCRTRYHFIIQADNVKEQRCASCISASTRCKKCELEISRDTDLEDETKTCELEISRDTDLEDETRLDLEDERHLLHGIIHVNGFGHLLRVNGREGGSKYLFGCDIMGLWDRICIMLKARKISVMDVSKKYGLDYRLLHAVQKGHPWYGNWGYEFGRGSFGTTHETYKRALQCISKLHLDLVLSGVGGFDQELKQIVSFYRSLSKNPLVTVQDLVCFVMHLLHKFHNHTERKRSGDIMINRESAESKWAPKVVDEITAAMLKVLQVADETMWITWHDLRGAACHGRDPQLSHHALMGLEGKTIGKQIVQCQYNSVTRTLEYRLTDRNNVSIDLKSASDPKQLKEEHVLEDLKTLYHALLHPQSQPPPTTNHSPLQHVLISGSLHYGLEEELWCYGLKEQLWRYGLRNQLTNASRNLMDCKQFIKNYEAKHHMITDSESIRVFVVAEILNGAQTLQKTPPELLIMPKNATIADLKKEAAQAFRDVYICFKSFHVQSVKELQNIKDSTTLMLLIGPESVVTVQGYCSGDISKYRAERGTQVWTVSCPCGTWEDDGERMIACDNCEVWQHTRCIGISDSEDVPPEYMCEDCNDNSLEVDVDSDHSLPGSSSVSSFY